MKSAAEIIDEIRWTEEIIGTVLNDPRRDDVAVNAFIDDADRNIAAVFQDLRRSDDPEGMLGLSDMLAGLGKGPAAK